MSERHPASDESTGADEVADSSAEVTAPVAPPPAPSATKPSATEPPHRPAPGEPLAAGETILLVDPKGREYLRDLKPGKRFSLHCGVVDADAIIGRPDASRITSSLGQTFLAFRPSYARLIPNLPRQAQVVYPKDAASIVVWGDIFPGARVIESGVGPGALTMALLRAIGPHGHLTSIERREDHVQMARDNIARFHGPAPNWDLVLADAADALPTLTADRVILDLPEPGPLIPAAAQALRPGGILVVYVPTTIQVDLIGQALRSEPRFGMVETFETLQRFWHVAPNSVRPDHRMVAHTGFIVTALRLADDA
jgi:tRNA (adenine57-N1/adenine58-N1)-methyltransferase